MTIGVLLSVFAVALLGGMHCAAMCGGIAMAIEGQGGGPKRAPRVEPVMLWRRRSTWLRSLLILHLGRLATYCLLGAMMGTIGTAAWKVEILPVQRWLFGAGSALLILAGIAMMRGGSAGWGTEWLERLVARRLGAMLPLMKRPGGEGRVPCGEPAMLRRFGIGLAWGMVPCGMVYGALALALLAGNAVSGAVVMGAFGLGTLPNLLMLSGLSGQLRRLARRPAIRTAAGLAIVGFGVAGVVRAAALPHTLAEQGFCLVF